MYLYIFQNNYSVLFQREQFKPFTVSCILTILQYMLHLVSRENCSNYLLFLGQINLALNVEAIIIIWGMMCKQFAGAWPVSQNGT